MLDKIAHRYTRSAFLWQYCMGLTLLVYAIGMAVTVMEIDGAVYAEVAREMYRSGNYFDIVLKGEDWLDKPHFQFWVTALSFLLFGVSSFSYKLPAVLFLLLGARYIYLFGRKFYSEKVGYIASLLLMTCQHILTSNSDVRAEPYLTGLTIFALYYLAAYLKDRRIFQLVLGSLGLAMLLMTKGLYTIIPVGAGLGLSMIYLRQWKQILHWQWLAVVGLTLLFITPTLFGYYQQFDLHPEKELFGQTNVSGIKFFLWDSQWGRFTNTGPIKGAGDPTFFLHTMLWAYLPWAFVAYFALYDRVRMMLRKEAIGEVYTFFGFAFLFVVFSLSSFQLPHYLNAIFPFLSIITADALFRYSKNIKFNRVFYHIHLWSSVLILLLVPVIHFVFSDQSLHEDVYFVFLTGLALIMLLHKLRGQHFRKLLFVPAIAVLLVNYYINRNFYPNLIEYQSESEVAFYMQHNDIDASELVVLGMREEATSFLLDRIVLNLDEESANSETLSGKYVFTNDEGLKKLAQMNLRYEKQEAFPDFRITTLNGTFLNKKTRDKELEIKYLVKIF